MKKFLLYIVIAIAVVSLGLTIYYFSIDNEAIYIKSSYMVINKGDTISTLDKNNELLDFKNRSEYTTLRYSSQNEDILSYNENEYFFTAQVGGETKITITTSNRQYKKFIIDVLVCDGSEKYPYIIKTEEELNNIKKDEITLSYYYKLGNDITLTEVWTPISCYAKTFDGNYFSIKNMVITDDSLNSSAITNAGFISVLEKTGVIKNLFLEDVYFDCSVEYMGAFAGTNKGLIQTSEATGVLINTKTDKTTYVGGVSGQTISSDSKAKIDRCGFEGSIEGAGSSQTMGGLTGLGQGSTVSESYCRAVIKNDNNKFGGIVGLNQNTENFAANVYDSYFYLTDKTSATNFSKMKGVVYSNTDSNNNNEIMGNYYGGKFAKNDVNLAPDGNSLKSSSNGYLTSILSEDSSVDFIDKTKFITVKYSDPTKETRYWDFDSVWEITSNGNYPILNVYSSVGSSYLIDVSSIITGNHITNAQQLYDVLNNSTTTDTFMIANDISLDPNASDGFVWGDSTTNHAIPNKSFKGTIINGTTIDEKTGLTRPCEIKNITIKNETKGENVGLVKELNANATFSGLVIKNVTIVGQNGNNVGVLAGISFGAHIYNVKIEQVVVNISGNAFGTVFGYAKNYEGHGIDNVSVKYVNASESYFVHAGGLVGINFATITTETSTYNTAYSINFVANYVGGIAGSNGGKINKCNAQNIVFNVKQSAKSITTVYSGSYNVFVGGIVGMNKIIMSDKTVYQGTISNVYANAKIDAETALNYKLYFGGIAGHNSNYIVRAYVNDFDVNVEGSHSVFVGGLVGYNSGRIANSVVDKQSSIITSIASSISATSNYVLNTDNCSIVGGLVGCDTQTTNSTYSLYECATYANTLQGYYVGGLSGLSFGKVEYCYCGDSTKTNGGVSIFGHMVGGISSVIAGGFVNNCYSFCSLSTGSMGGTYKDITSALNMDVRCMGGISVFVFNKTTQVSGCYVVASFSGNGVSYGSCADGYTGGKVENCIYEKVGSIKTSIGTQLTSSYLKGSDGYKEFKKAIGSTSIWNLNNGYPTIVGINVRLPGETLPVI